MSPYLMDILLGVGPIVLLLGAWYLFMRRFTGPGSIQERQFQLTERQIKALERIAEALERRGQ